MAVFFMYRRYFPSWATAMGYPSRVPHMFGGWRGESTEAGQLLWRALAGSYVRVVRYFFCSVLYFSVVRDGAARFFRRSGARSIFSIYTWCMYVEIVFMSCVRRMCKPFCSMAHTPSFGPSPFTTYIHRLPNFQSKE